MPRFLRSFLLLVPILLPATTVAAEAVIPTDLEPGRFYALRPDPRACPSPMCGGYWVRSVNRSLTRCVDGSEQQECYVAGLRHVPASGLGDGHQVLVQGRLRTQEFAGFGTFGVLAIRSAWLAATDAAADGRFLAIENNGIACITSPCFSYDEFVLNRGVVRQLSGLDFDAVPKPDGGSWGLLADGEYLIAAGRNEQREEFEGIGLWFVASQVFTRIP